MKNLLAVAILLLGAISASAQYPAAAAGSAEARTRMEKQLDSIRAAQGRGAKAVDPEYITLHDRSGWFEMSAKVVSIKKGKDDYGKETLLVTLHRQQDKTGAGWLDATFPVESFHPHDEEYLRKKFTQMTKGEVRR